MDWMIKVFDKMGLHSKTFFMAVNMLDLYLFYSMLDGEFIKEDDLYLITITILHISCKYEEVPKILLSFILKQNGKNLYSRREVLEMEKKILQKI